MKLSPEILNEFKKITGKDISLYFRNSVIFFSSDYNAIVNYYSGTTNTIESKPFENFEILKEQNRQVFEAFKEHSRQFKNVKWYLLIEAIEEIDSRLSTLAKINKWARSSRTNVAFNPNLQIEYKLAQNESLENVSSNFLGNTSKDDWMNIAFDNNLIEENYTNEGGVNVNLTLPVSNSNFKIYAVVDVIKGKSIYGKDVYKNIQFEDNDLKTLGYDDTIIQAVNILSSLKKNDNPDNPTAGVQSNMLTGTNKVAFAYPILIRQSNQTFAGDDTLKNFKIIDFQLDQDNQQFSYSVQTRLNEVIQDGEFS